MIIIELEGGSDAFNDITGLAQTGNLYRLRIAIDEGTVKFKANEDTWSWGYDVPIKTQGDPYELLRDIGQTPATREPELPYGLKLGELLTDWPDPKQPPQGLWRVEPLGLLDLAGGDDWDWQGLISNGGLGTLQKLTPAASHA